MLGCYNESPLTGHNVERAVVEINIALTIDKIHSPFDETVVHKIALVHHIGRAIGVLIGEHTAPIDNGAVALGVKGQGLRPVVMSCSP